MPIYLDTRGLTSLAIAVCDRCKMKVPFVSLVQDGNTAGLRVCENRGCRDEKDPYRLPARKTERINLRFPRPDVSVATDPDSLITGGTNIFEITAEGNTATPETNGNLDNIAPSP